MPSSFEVRHSDDLKQWLIRELEPICDADPEVLSDYVLALLKHDEKEDELEAKLQEQLEDFLAEQTNAFVHKTLDALRTQSYLPPSKRSAGPGSSEASTSALSAQGTSRKRSAGDEGRRSPAKTLRDADSNGDGSRRREYDTRERRDANGSDSAEGSADAKRADGGQRTNKPLCRDFHQRGFCARGDSCRFDHSLPSAGEAGSPHQMPLPMQQRMGPQGPFPMQGQQQQPFNPQQHMQQHPQHFQQMPQMHMGMGPNFNLTGPPPPMGWNPQAMGGMHANEGNAGQGAFDGASQQSNEGDSRGGRGGFGGHRGGRGAMRGGAGRGTFERRPQSSTTLVIENVPSEHLELVKVNEYFKKFGTITNIQIDVDGKKALVSFSQPAEAKAAHSSPEVIFGNRFVKVYFQKLDDPFVKPKESVAPPAAAAPPKNNFVPGKTSNKFVRPNLAQEKAKGAQEQAQKKLDTLMDEQKEIMEKLMGGSASADEKKTLMARFGSLEGEIKQATEDVRNAVNGISTPSSGPSKQAAGSPAAGWKDQREVREREQLDRELEALKNSGTANGATTEELKETLARLQAEAEQLGIDAENASAPSFRGGFRGRARGAFRGAGARGRGGSTFNRGPMSLDNRTSRLHIFDLPTADAGPKVKEFLNQFGEVQSFTDKDDGSLIVHYKARASGERAVRSGLSVPDVGTIKAQWTSEGASAVGTDSKEGEDAAGDAGVSADAAVGGEGEDEEHEREEHFRR